MTRVFVGVPAYGGLHQNCLAGLMAASLVRPFTVNALDTSLLAHTFNSLWVQCLNSGEYTHFAMAHNDIEAPSGWVDQLIDELGDAEVISAVVRIKDHRRLVSTAVLRDDGAIRQLSLDDLAGLPPTFGPTLWGGKLLVNSGLWVARLGPWARAFPGFRINSGIVALPTGELVARCRSEDDNFSRWCHANGVRLLASQSLPVVHHGVIGFGLSPVTRELTCPPPGVKAGDQ